MKCYECKNQIEVGEATRTEYLVGTHRVYFHVGCHVQWFTRRSEQKADASNYFEELARQARSVC